MAGRRIDFIDKAFLKPLSRSERLVSSITISSEIALRAFRSWENVVIPDKSFVSIENTDKQFYEDVKEEAAPEEEHHRQSNKEDTSDYESGGGPASD